MRLIDADALFDSLIFPNDQWKATFKELLDDEPTVENKGDLISRQAILDRTVNRNSIWNKITDSEGNNLEDILNSIPSAENKGEWLDSSNGWTCSICNRDSKRDTDFCPNCKARMKGSE